MTPDSPHPKPRRPFPWLWLALGLYILGVFALVGAYVRVTNREVPHALLFQGPQALVAGQTHLFRGLFLDAPTGRSLLGARVGLSLRDQQGALVARSEARTGPGGFAHLALQPPANLAPGRYRLALEASHPEYPGMREALDVALQTPTPSAPPWPLRSARSDDFLEDVLTGHDQGPGLGGPLRIDLLPPDGELVRGLGNTLFLRVSERHTGRPVQARLRTEKLEGVSEGPLPQTLQSDALGLVRVEVVPVGDLRWTVSAEKLAGATPVAGESLRGQAILRMHTVAAQFALRPNHVLVRPGEPLEALVESLYRSGGMLAEAYSGASMVAAGAFGMGAGPSGVRLELPKLPAGTDAPGTDGPGLVRVQVYQSFFDPADAWDAQWLAIAPPPDPALAEISEERRTAQALAGLLAQNAHPDHRPYYQHLAQGDFWQGLQATPAQERQWLEALLMALPRAFEPPRHIVNTQRRDREQLEAWKRLERQKLRRIALGLFAVAMCALAGFVARALARARAQQQAMAALSEDLDDGAGEDADATPPSLAFGGPQGLERLSVALQGVVIVATVVIFGLSLLMLLSYL